MEFSEELFNKDYVGLAWTFQVSPDSCNNPDYYTQYIRFNALSNHIKGMGVTHILIDTAKQNIAGFITLRATSLVSEGTDKIKLVEPAIEIAELAVDAKYERQGIGSALIGIAIDVSDELRKKVIGIRHIVVCADKSAIEFYKKLGFGELSSLYEVLLHVCGGALSERADDSRFAFWSRSDSRRNLAGHKIITIFCKSSDQVPLLLFYTSGVGRLKGAALFRRQGKRSRGLPRLSAGYGPGRDSRPEGGHSLW